MIKKNKIKWLNKNLETLLNQPKIKKQKQTPISIFQIKGLTLVNMFNIANYFKFFPKNAFFTKSYLFGMDKKFFIKAYVTQFLKRLVNISFKTTKSTFHYFIIKETRKQSFVALLDSNKKSHVTYSTGLLLCAMGFKKHNAYRSLKKQNKGFIKGLSFVKMYVLPKFLKSTETGKKTVGVVIKGRGKFTATFSELPRYFAKLKTETLFILWLPTLRFSYTKLRQYGRIKRNFRKRIVKTLALSEKLKRSAPAVNVS